MKWLFIPMLFVAVVAHAEEPSFTGFVDAAYLWNQNRPSNHENFVPGTGTSGKRGNEFSLNLAQVQWSREVSAEQPVSFTLSLVAAQGPEVVDSGEPQTAATPPLQQPRPEEMPAEQPPAEPVEPLWQFGGFADVGYLLDFNYPENDLWRSRGTTFRVNQFELNMAALYLKKKAVESSRWGTELTIHEGVDSEVFGFSATAPNLRGSKQLTQLGPTNVSYLAPVGKGLTLQGGIFSSFIGYDSLYAKDNLNYTRPWGADFTPYLMLGVNGSYPLTDKLTGALFAVNGYWHLADANNVPSSGGQLAYKPTDRWTLKQAVIYGPHQSDTSLEFWRFLSDSIVEWKGERVTAAFEYFVGTEKIAAPGKPGAVWMSAQLPVRWTVNPRVSVAVRPELYRDLDGRTTGSEQSVKALTSTVDYRVGYQKTKTILRLEHRFDDSRGNGGGFFNRDSVGPGLVGLKTTQHLLIFAAIFTFDSPIGH